jgi:hypothetical protein
MTIHDMAQGLSPAPKKCPIAAPEQIAATEAALGFSLPELLKRIFSEIGTGRTDLVGWITFIDSGSAGPRSWKEIYQWPGPIFTNRSM